MASFEALNVSSIQPLPPIKPDPSSPEKKFNFKSEPEEETQLHKIKKNDKKVLPSVVPRPAGVGYNGRYEFYINDRIPTEKEPLNEPLFELTKKDQMKAQRHIHKKIVDNDMTKRKSLKLDEDINVDYVLQLTDNENRLFHQNSKLLNIIHDGYKDYIEYLVSRQIEPDSTLNENERELAEASIQLREKENEAEETLREIDKLNDIHEAEPEYRTVRVKVDPKYNQLTNDYIMLTHQIQNQLNKSKEIANDIQSMSTWNVRLEENLILEEKELDSEMQRAQGIIDQASYDDELAAIFAQI